MREIIIAIILGIVQGLTEFLPVSSSGHLTLVQDIFGISENVLFTNVALHFGTLLAVIIYYFKDVTDLFRPKNYKTVLYLVIATIPAGLVMLLLGDLVEEVFTAKYICFGFLATAIVLLVAEFIGRRIKKTKPIGFSTAAIMGLAQAAAIFPGLSRSGSTITAGLVSKSERSQAAKFSFLMSIPVIAGSTIFEILTVDFSSINIIATIVGVITSFVAGFFAIKIMMKLIGKCNFKWFSLYLFALSIVTFINAFVVAIW